MTETVTAAILVIGDEILSGRTKDKNIGYIAEYMTNIGVDVREVRVVPDVEEEIVRCCADECFDLVGLRAIAAANATWGTRTGLTDAADATEAIAVEANAIRRYVRAVVTTFSMPTNCASRTVIRLREASSPTRNVVGP